MFGVNIRLNIGTVYKNWIKVGQSSNNHIRQNNRIFLQDILLVLPCLFINYINPGTDGVKTIEYVQQTGLSNNHQITLPLWLIFGINVKTNKIYTF